MKSISLKVPDALDTQLSELSRRTGRSKSLVIRMALREFLLSRSRAAGRSLMARASDLAGCVRAAPDLSTNKRRLEGYGR